MKEHIVKQGECLSTIAKQHGFASYKDVYFHASNADLRRERPNPNILYPGDTVKIPDRELKQVAVATGAFHTFQVRRNCKVLRLKLETAENKLIKDHPYVLRWNGANARPVESTTDGSGMIELDVPEGAVGAELALEGEPRPRVLKFSHLNPLRGVPDKGVSGVQARLKNLGYDPGPIDGVVGPWTRGAARAFAKDAGVPHDDPLGNALIASLEKTYGA